MVQPELLVFSKGGPPLSARSVGGQQPYHPFMASLPEFQPSACKGSCPAIALRKQCFSIFINRGYCKSTNAFAWLKALSLGQLGQWVLFVMIPAVTLCIVFRLQLEREAMGGYLVKELNADAITVLGGLPLPAGAKIAVFASPPETAKPATEQARAVAAWGQLHGITLTNARLRCMQRCNATTPA
jgi:hypothetical protein